jgi:hypothetical protein
VKNSLRFRLSEEENRLEDLSAKKKEKLRDTQERKIKK